MAGFTPPRISKSQPGFFGKAQNGFRLKAGMTGVVVSALVDREVS